MKKLGLIVVAALIAGPAMADNHGTKVSGQIFADHLISGDGGNKDKVGFSIDRARVKVDHMFNDSWMGHIAVEGKNQGSTFIKKAYVKGMNVFTKGDHFRFGVASNTWKDVLYTKIDNRWIEKVGAHALSYNNDENSGLRYGNFSKAFKYSLGIHSGTEAATDDGKADDAYGMELYLAYDFNKMMGLHIMLDNRAEDKAKNAKQESTSVAFNYKRDKVSAIIEHAQFKVGTADARSFTALMVDYKYSDKNGVYASMRNHNTEEEAVSGKSNMVVGHHWMLAKGLKTGLFYSVAKPSTGDDTTAITWKWEAKL